MLLLDDYKIKLVARRIILLSKNKIWPNKTILVYFAYDPSITRRKPPVNLSGCMILSMVETSSSRVFRLKNKTPPGNFIE